MERNQLPGWIGTRLAAHKQSADRQGIDFIAERVEGNLLAAHQEIQKLGLLYPAGPLGLEQVREAVLNVARYDIDSLREALLAGDMARLTRTLDGLQHEGEAPPLVLWALGEEIRALPIIRAQPGNVTVATGGTASFTVVATGATGYQWTFNGGAISGATGPTHTIANAQAAHAGSYFVILTNAAGSLNSDPATLTVNAPVPPPAPPPSSGSRGGGGGAPSLWFYGAVSALCLARLLFRRRG